MNQNFDEITERLLQAPYWVIDFLPMQVPPESRGQFFAIEKYFFSGPQLEQFCRQAAHVVLKINCYHDLTVNRGDDDWVKNPEPATLVSWLHEALEHGHLCALIDDGDAMITASGGDSCLALYNPSDGLIELVRQLATATGLYLW
ncbi:MAG: hypothetical protein IJV05_09965 [Muribaculaceae bacterium]|nr:hypothetical protein [Muribaculaceae bacterium]